MNRVIYHAILNVSILSCALAASPTRALDGAKLYHELGCVSCHGDANGQPVLPLYPKLAGLNASYLKQQASDILSGQRSGGLTLSMRVSARATDEELTAISDYLATVERPADSAQSGAEQRQQFAHWSNAVIEGGFNAVQTTALDKQLSKKGDYRKGDFNKNQLAADSLFYSSRTQPSPATVAAGKALYLARGCTGCHGEGGQQPPIQGYPMLAGQSTRYSQAQLAFTRDGVRTNGQTMLMKGFAATLSNDDMRALSDYLATSTP